MFSPVASLPDEQVNQALKKPWAQDGRHWSSRLWEHKDQLANQLQGELMRVLIQGKSPVQAGKQLAKRLHVGETQAVRLMQTECTYIQSLADKESAVQMGVKKMQYLATLEAHTCGTCGELDEKVFPVKDLVPGITAPPIHPHCRCTLVPYFEDAKDDRWMKDENGEPQIIHDMPFIEWEKKYIFDALPNPTKGNIINPTIWEQAIFTEEKFTKYALNPTGKGADKAKAFSLALGYNLSN